MRSPRTRRGKESSMKQIEPNEIGGKHRRAWLLLSQLLVFLACVVLSVFIWLFVRYMQLQTPQPLEVAHAASEFIRETVC